ncbi:MAG: hypothetical protein OEW18_04455 [Candidatus Aminicenantes bacterium]|nr:hypothetical protein [Candidatus Aminicenantes bacterium]
MQDTISSKYGKSTKVSNPFKSAVLLMLWLPISAGYSAAQTQEPTGSRVYLDVFGPGLLYSFNYERNLSHRLGVRLGAGGTPFSGFTYILSFGMLTLTVGGPVHSLHTGLGAGIGWFQDLSILEEINVLEAYGVFSVGYQFQPRPRGIFFRLTYTPFFNFHVVEPLWGGITAGYAF